MQGSCRTDIRDAAVIEPVEIGDEDAEEREVMILVVIDLIAEITDLTLQKFYTFLVTSSPFDYILYCVYENSYH